MEAMNHVLDMTGKTILVTGASQGLGATIAQCASRVGACVVLVARRVDVLEQVALTLDTSRAGQRHWVMAFDLQKISEIPSLYQKITEECGGCDGLVHGAGLQPIKGLGYVTARDVNSTFVVGVQAGWHLAQAWAALLAKEQREGSLVFLSSVAAYAGQPGLATYSASKGAVEAMTRQLAQDFLSHRIRVNSVVAGQVLTPSAQRLQHHLTDEQWEQFRARHPLGFGKPEDVAHAVLFLLSRASRWMTGTHLVVDGGYLAQ